MDESEGGSVVLDLIAGNRHRSGNGRWSRSKLYDAAIEFVAWRYGLPEPPTDESDDLERQLSRDAMSICVEVKEAGYESGPERTRCFREARRAVIRCAAILDLLQAYGRLDAARKETGRRMLLDLEAGLRPLVLTGETGAR